MTNKIELLSPAGDMERLKMSLAYGADAVYLGWGAFNARRGAKNCSDEEFAAALAYCHERGVRVFLTLNTLVTDRELPQALETAVQAGRLGVDAVLVQDWGLLTLAREIAPDLPIQRDRARIRRTDTAKHFCKRGFADPAFSENAADLAVGNIKRNVLKHRISAKAFFNILNGDHSAQHLHSRLLFFLGGISVRHRSLAEGQRR